MDQKTERAVENKALQLLARREFSRMELRRKLETLGATGESAAATVEKFAAVGWQSDERFTEAFVRGRIARGIGPLRVRFDLEQRGVARELVDRVLNANGVLWQSALRKLVEQRKEACAQSTQAQARIIRFLQGRGFALDQIISTIKDLDVDKPC